MIHTAIIGCGTIHTTHAEAIKTNSQVRLAAVADIDEARAAETAAKYGCAYYTDYKELLKQESVDAVHLCVPHYLHKPMAVDAMRAGKHVLTEKPMALSEEDAWEMIRVSEETGKTLGVCFQNRYNATSQRIKEVITSGKAGRILGGKAFVTWHRDAGYYNSAAWRGTWEKEGGGVLINQAIHTLDLLQWFMGDIDKIKGSVDNRLLQGVIEVEDTAEATLHFANGAPAIFYFTNSYVTDSPITIELVCEKAVIRLDSDAIIRYANGETEHVTEVDQATGDKAYWGCSHKALIDDFYTKILQGEPFGIDGKQGITAIKIIQAVYKSHRDRDWISLKGY